MDIRILGAHNCEAQDTKLACLLIDEVIAIDAGGLTSSLSFAAQQKLKAILLTHHHYDHIRDIPAIGMNLFLRQASLNVYGTSSVMDAVTAHLLNGTLYSRLHEQPADKPTLKLNVIEPGKAISIAGYEITAVPVRHAVPTTGYQVTSSTGKTMFYTSDTGPGLEACWENISPQLLITEVTAPDGFREFALTAGHLTPTLLKQELISFREIKGYLPPVVVVHMNPAQEKEIADGIAAVAAALGSPVSLAHEGMRLKL